MTIVSQLAMQIDVGVQERGQRYYDLKAVISILRTGYSIIATVKGDQRYNVILTRVNEGIRLSCTCPFYKGMETPCKHIWAVVLAADKHGYLTGWPATIQEKENSSMKEKEDNVHVYSDEDDDDDEDALASSGQNSKRSHYEQMRMELEESLRLRSSKAQQLHRAPKNIVPPSSSGWKTLLGGLRDVIENNRHPDAASLHREIYYVVDVPATMVGKGLILQLTCRERKKNGEWGKTKPFPVSLDHIAGLSNPLDGQIISYLVGAANNNQDWRSPYNLYSSFSSLKTFQFTLSSHMQESLLPLMCQTGRCLLRKSPENDLPLQWDAGPPWEFWLEVRHDEKARQYVLNGALKRNNDERMELSTPVMLLSGGLVFTQERAAKLSDFGAFGWIGLLRKLHEVRVPVAQGGQLLEQLFHFSSLPKLKLPEELKVEESVVTPQPRLNVRPAEKYDRDRLYGKLSFAYDKVVVSSEQSGKGIFQADLRRMILRDQNAERAAAEYLHTVGFRPSRSYYGNKNEFELSAKNLPGVVRKLIDAGWHVEADGKLYRSPGSVQIAVRSGIDWFELHADVKFGTTTAKLPELLAALRRGETSVSLGDGTFGLLPEEWLKKYGLLAGLGTVKDGHLEFTRSQAGVLDALLVSQPLATCDAVFERVRNELRRFESILPVEPPATFVGQLREYQREGLGWLYFLQQFGFGGCLADDMGLGKTVQVLALLESRRMRRSGGQADNPGETKSLPTDKKQGLLPGIIESTKPSLVVVPRSLIFNWKQEAARFTPALRVLDNTGIGRARTGARFDEYDMVLTTYGTLRRDALQFKDLEFDYIILDEAQAIKNAGSESAKAVRLLRGAHRLALSGTPVQNHLSDLWSLFEFLNPGMLGSASVFKMSDTASSRTPDEQTRTILARALRPFILRRTKEQVARDLPQKLEQTVYCEMEPEQRKHYDELRAHYRNSLLPQIDRDGLNKSKIQILEALLRLRQAACHPGLIDKARTAESSAKLEMLMPRLAEVMDEGHKVLVFSQFTSFLAIVRKRLDAAKIPYEYLDGRTLDRQEKVEKFQNDPTCKLFLISIKAGGLGLNLTAAQYVFLLDPWWNPAIEAQAIDRAHRIGQTRQVFAYRLIARGTVEEKVLELQNSKRALADAIINADNSLIRDLGREDLELLLS